MVEEVLETFRSGDNCNCSLPQRLADDKNSPVYHVRDTNEYYVGDEHGMSYIMHYCFFCGGRMPEIKRSTEYTDPLESELLEAREMVSKIKSADEVSCVLGEPDDEFDYADAPEEIKSRIDKGLRKQYTFHSKWKTLQILIRTFEDGHIEDSYSGKPISHK